MNLKRRNRLYITWGGFQAVLNHTQEGAIDSFKCNSLKAAKKVLDKRNVDNIKEALWIDKNGHKTKIL